MKAYTAIGLMSGTSVDGVDAALIRTDGVNYVEPLAFFERPYTDDERDIIRAALGIKSLEDACVKATQDVITRTHIEAVNSLLAQENIGRAEIDLIGFHGQTIYHNPADKITIQIGDASALAAATGIKTVYDFRKDDVRAGGQGAPFLPLYHRARIIAEEVACPVAILNLGGVGNITWIGAGHTDDDILAFDTGPANALMDDLVKSRTGQSYDENGALARRGAADPKIVAQALAHTYFVKQPPKSLDRDEFADVLSALEGTSLENALATLAEITVQTVAQGFTFLSQKPLSLYVTGGGRHNGFVMDQLAAALGIAVAPVESIGWNGDTLEAEGFAYLAVRHFLELPLSLPKTTGVPQPTIGGMISLPQV